MTEEKKEEEEIVNETIDFRKRLVKPHKKKSKKVTDKDLPKLLEDAHVMYNLCHTQIGPIPGSYAIHHAQIENKHPLNFFVTVDKEIVINPKIIRHTEVAVDRIEGSTSHPYNPPIKVKRFNKVEVELSNLNNDGTIGPVYIKKLSGIDAQIYQHLTDLGKAKYIYEDEKNIQGGDTEDM